MKKLIFFLLLTVIVISSCEKQEVPIYQQEGGAFFALTSKMQTTEYSFLLHPTVDFDTVKLDVFVTGDTSAYDRVFNSELVLGENTTAEDDQYEILEGIVPAGKSYGILPVKIYKTEALNDSIYSIEIALAESKDFPIMDFSLCTYKVSFTSLIVKPRKYDRWCSRYFGSYSTNWFRFILSVTGDPELGTNNKSKLVYYSYQSMLRIALRDYNNSHEDPLRHDDGTIVVMPS